MYIGIGTLVVIVIIVLVVLMLRRLQSPWRRCQRPEHTRIQSRADGRG
jgi:Sec-independent protein translocase protein TatA